MNAVAGRVEGKVALVTGGASGLGRAIAALFVKHGATTIISDIQEMLGQQTAKEIGAAFMPQDVSSETQWQSILGSIKSDYGRLDILVNNAGISGPIENADPETTSLVDWQSVQVVNSQSVFLGCKHVIPLMREAGGGSIINISSIAALVATPFIAAYGASKAAVRQHTKSVALHCATTGSKIRCNSVHPGQIITPMHDKLISETARLMGVSEAEAKQQFLSRIPYGEYGEPDDIAFAVLYLASDEAKHVTGIQMVVDGGMELSG